ncbi:cytochrome P450 [Coprinopsis cinerea okayama7|uniref:Cytochrome P450 n=1 Tax=Coprinopsis cinerea (strain Okayama-7 / 130 / ATCC MYA-4618 / FGSC 9003) TaxID=240176 RepID=A8PC62_COPC7|nr:cytochrome P450 [Coprinopsis cinerea okayama7\|eukprot:XP_001840324.2 cytochrome P450 [Coprinopsis cinerea okayama7\
MDLGLPVPDFGVLVATVALVVVLKQWSWRRRTKGYPTPPGPRGWPILGNIGGMPSTNVWLKFMEWGREYDSGIVYTEVAGGSFLIINSLEKAVEILDKRSGIYSDRPDAHLFDMMGYGYMLSRLSYGEQWRERRRLFQQHLRPSRTNVYQPKILDQVRRSMIQFEKRPTDGLNVLRHTVGGIALSLAYGLKIHPNNDPYVKSAEENLRPLFTAGLAGVHLVNIFPFLRHLPAWLPGFGFKREALKHQVKARAFREKPFSECQARIADSTATTSFTSLALEEMARVGKVDDSTLRDAIMDTAAIVFAAGSDTTVSTLSFWLRNMVAYPEIQRRVQQELDEVLQGRLPDFTDEDCLPWVKATIMETMRMDPTNPTALFHRSIADDIFDGYFIPKGTTVIPNSWAMLHDENYYPNAMNYNPERFIKNGRLDPDVLNPNRMAFGYGRRECPGSHIAEAVLFIAAGTILSLFDIQKPLDDNGEPVSPQMEVLPGVVSHPVPFGCVFKPRNGSAQTTLLDLESTYEL